MKRPTIQTSPTTDGSEPKQRQKNHQMLERVHVHAHRPVHFGMTSHCGGLDAVLAAHSTDAEADVEVEKNGKDSDDRTQNIGRYSHGVSPSLSSPRNVR